MKKTIRLTAIFALCLVVISAVSCSREHPSPYMKSFSEKLIKAVHNADYLEIDEYFGTPADFGKMISNAKTTAMQKKLKASWMRGIRTSFRKTIRQARKKAGKLKRISFVHLAYDSPEDPTIMGSPVKFGYVSMRPANDYILFKYWTVGEKIVISYFKYMEEKPSGKNFKVFQIGSDVEAEDFENKTTVSYTD